MKVEDLISDVKLEDPEAFDEIVPAQWRRYLNRAVTSIRPLLKEYDPGAFEMRPDVTVVNGVFDLPEDFDTSEQLLVYSDLDYSPLPSSYFELRGNTVKTLYTTNGVLKLFYHRELPLYTEDDQELLITKRKAIEVLISEVKRFAYLGTNEGEGSNASDEAIKDINQII